MAAISTHSDGLQASWRAPKSGLCVARFRRSDDVKPLPREIHGLARREGSAEQIPAALCEPDERGLGRSGGKRSKRLVDGGLPSLLRDRPGGVLGGNDADIVLRS